MRQEILSKFAQLQTENRNQKQELKRYSQMLIARDEEEHISLSTHIIKKWQKVD